MKNIHYWFCMGLCVLMLSIPVKADDRARQLMDAVESGNTNIIENILSDADSKQLVTAQLIEQVREQSAIAKERARALRALVAIKAPEAVEPLLDIKTSWILDDQGASTESISVFHAPHVLALITIGEPSIKAILSDQYLGRVVESGELNTYAAVILGIKGHEKARTLIDDALQDEISELKKSNLIALGVSIDRFIALENDNARTGYAP